MYSRYGDDSRRHVRLPEHYGGSAFSQMPTAPATVSQKEFFRAPTRGGVEEKASPTADRFLRSEPSEEANNDATVERAPTANAADLSNAAALEQTLDEAEKEAIPVSQEKDARSSAINFAGLRRLLGGVEGERGEDNDRLLLLGLILLLSRTEGDSDILLWLSLLLLCG